MRCNVSWFFTVGNTHYYITRDGRVLSTRNPESDTSTWREIAQYNGKGYRRVRLGGKNFKVHRLVAKHFVDNPDNLPYVLHVDGDRTNNQASNLKWSDKQSNHEGKSDTPEA